MLNVLIMYLLRTYYIHLYYIHCFLLDNYKFWYITTLYYIVR